MKGGLLINKFIHILHTQNVHKMTRWLNLLACNILNIAKRQALCLLTILVSLCEKSTQKICILLTLINCYLKPGLLMGRMYKTRSVNWSVKSYEWQ